MKFHQVIFFLSLFILPLSHAAPTGNPSVVTELVPFMNTISERLLPRRPDPSDSGNNATSNSNSKGESSSSSSIAIVNTGKGAETSVGASPDKSPEETQQGKNNSKKETIIASAVGGCIAVALAIWMCRALAFSFYA
ncbi:hypothetical protein BZA77DRAFT_298066 [Pyronema omphalodes]|nr:hypothetical protein BZA77DRAFT_298066 [Pyronema omphalodes]